MKNITTPFALAVICAGLLLTSVSAKADVYFRDPDRVVLKEYVTAPKEHVIFYSAGTVMPSTVTYTELPETVTTRLIAPPANSTYVNYGGNVYLIDRGSRKIIDSVELY